MHTKRPSGPSPAQLANETVIARDAGEALVELVVDADDMRVVDVDAVALVAVVAFVAVVGVVEVGILVGID